MGKVRKVKTRTPSGVDTSADLMHALDAEAAGEAEACGPIEAICVHLQRPDVEEKFNLIWRCSCKGDVETKN